MASLGTNIIIDEIQRVPELTVAVKHAIDSNRSHVIMTGSSSIGLLDASADSLAGRVHLQHFPTACWGEHLGPATHQIFREQASLTDLLEATRDFENVLKFGGFPEVLSAKSNSTKQQILKNYRDTYFTRDLAQLSNVENIEGLLAILHHAARAICSHLEISSFAKASGLSHPTAKKYVNTLTQSGLAFKLYGYHHGPAKRYLKGIKTLL